METAERKIDLYNVAEVKLSYSANVEASQRQRPKVDYSKQVFEVYSENWEQDKIEFVEDSKVMLLSRANRVPGGSQYQLRRYCGDSSGCKFGNGSYFKKLLKLLDPVKTSTEVAYHLEFR